MFKFTDPDYAYNIALDDWPEVKLVFKDSASDHHLSSEMALEMVPPPADFPFGQVNLSFELALLAMKSGRRVARKTAPGFIFYFDTDAEFICEFKDCLVDGNGCLNSEDLLATDWQVLS